MGTLSQIANGNFYPKIEMGVFILKKGVFLPQRDLLSQFYAYK